MAIEQNEKVKASLSTVGDGKPLKAKMFVRRIPVDQIPIEDEKKCADFVHKLYQEKVRYSYRLVVVVVLNFYKS